MPGDMPGLRELSAALRAGQTTSTQLVERALEKTRLSKSVFTSINPGLVRLSYSIDRARKKSDSVSLLAGIPMYYVWRRFTKNPVRLTT